MPTRYLCCQLADDRLRSLPCWDRVPIGRHSGSHGLPTGILPRGHGARRGSHEECHVPALPTGHLERTGRLDIGAGLQELRREVCVPHGGNDSLRDHRPTLSARSKSHRCLLRKFAGLGLPSGLWLRTGDDFFHPVRLLLRSGVLVQGADDPGRDTKSALPGRLLLQAGDRRIGRFRTKIVQMSARLFLSRGHSGRRSSRGQPARGRAAQRAIPGGNCDAARLDPGLDVPNLQRPASSGRLRPDTM
mmetsp:Transcript_29163/g.69522  ORF Transcript_29163/g.69522 Transcript_29163/m.69522 type:complete len:246 (+) Transcript_29163:1204-1941(+)